MLTCVSQLLYSRLDCSHAKLSSVVWLIPISHAYLHFINTKWISKHSILAIDSPLSVSESSVTSSVSFSVSSDGISQPLLVPTYVGAPTSNRTSVPLHHRMLLSCCCPDPSRREETISLVLWIIYAFTLNDDAPQYIPHLFPFRDHVSDSIWCYDGGPLSSHPLLYFLIRWYSTDSALIKHFIRSSYDFFHYSLHAH